MNAWARRTWPGKCRKAASTKARRRKKAALRELEEEIGTAKAEILAASKDWLHYEVPAKKRPKGWRGRFRGQRQKWFALRFLGADSDIDIETEHPEFSTWRWVHHKDLPTLIVPFKRAVYLQVLEEFSELFRRTSESRG